MGKMPPLSTIIWVLAAWLLVFQFLTGPISPLHYYPPRTINFPNPVISRLNALLRYTELEEIEQIPVFPKRIKKPQNRKSHRFNNPDNEFPPEKRHFFFPDPNVACVDPRRDSDRQFFFPGREWRDLDGFSIQAHGGGILYMPQTRTFYWYGENKQGETYRRHKKSSARVDLIGMSCYSSQDLWQWKHEGIVLKANSTGDLHLHNVAERPKVIYNDKTKQYVMWLHVDNANYSKASVGIAISPSPTGPFTYLGSIRPHGFESRDMTIFKDEDGTAFLVYSSQSNSELHISELQPDYLGLTNKYSRALVNQHREAPAVFKHKGLYYMITSGCTGWSPNAALVHAAESVLGPWETLGDPCVGASHEFRSTTFYSQVSFVLPLPGLQDMFIFVADRWNPSNLSDSRYVWLPLTVDGPADEPVEDSFEFPIWSRVSIRWHAKWKLPDGWNDSTVNGTNFHNLG